MLQSAILSQSPVFKGLSENDLIRLFSQIHFQVRTYRKDELIVQGGDLCDRLLIVQKGIVKAGMTDYTGKTLWIEDVEAPRPLATAFLFGKENRFPVTVTAKTSVEIVVIPKLEFVKLLQLNSQILNNYLNTVSTRTQFLSQKLKFLSFKTIRQKVAYFLLEKSKEQGLVVKASQSQEQLAELFGVTRPSLARTLSEMKMEGLIDRSRGSIKINNIERMNNLLKA